MELQFELHMLLERGVNYAVNVAVVKEAVVMQSHSRGVLQFEQRQSMLI